MESFIIPVTLVSGIELLLESDDGVEVKLLVDVSLSCDCVALDIVGRLKVFNKLYRFKVAPRISQEH